MADDKHDDTETTETETCDKCKVEELLLAVGIASSACGFKDSVEEQTECRKWALGLDPSAIEDGAKIIDELLDRVGVDDVDKVAQTFNLMVQNGIISRVERKLQTKEAISPQEMALYKRYTSKLGI